MFSCFDVKAESGERGVNIMAKKAIAHHEQFLPLPHYFQTLSVKGASSYDVKLEWIESIYVFHTRNDIITTYAHMGVDLILYSYTADTLH